MTAGTFEDRVLQVHATWADRREVRDTSGSFFDTQYRLLQKLYDWTSEAVETIQSVYGEQAVTALSPRPDADSRILSFEVRIGSTQTLSIALSETGRGGKSQWRIKAMVRLENGRPSMAVGPARRTTVWTKRELENLLLSLLTAYERQL